MSSEWSVSCGVVDISWDGDFKWPPQKGLNCVEVTHLLINRQFPQRIQPNFPRNFPLGAPTQPTKKANHIGSLLFNLRSVYRRHFWIIPDQNIELAATSCNRLPHKKESYCIINKCLLVETAGIEPFRLAQSKPRNINSYRIFTYSYGCPLI